jgi:hypothetical protein
MVYLGIDPGASGGMAVLDGDAKVLLLTRMPETAAAHIAFLQRVMSHVTSVAQVLAAIELCHSSPQMGVRSAFSFGRSYERCLALAQAAGIGYLSPTPQAWQGELKCRTRGDKNVTLKAARHLFRSQVVVTLYTADALLLAEFARRHHVRSTRRRRPHV